MMIQAPHATHRICVSNKMYTLVLEVTCTVYFLNGRGGGSYTMHTRLRCNERLATERLQQTESGTAGTPASQWLKKASGGGGGDTVRPKQTI
jgi:hypothetical protein